jgi:hypothetical protein
MSPTNNDKAALVFACGIACKQVYTSGASGTFGVAQALDAYYRFNFSNIDILYDGDTSIKNKLINNMIDSLPSHLALIDPNHTIGHNVVVDGYDTDGFFHINFGWGGQSNGWYVFPAGIPHNLTVVEGLIIDINKGGTTTLPENENIDMFSAYPNPFKDEVCLKLKRSYHKVKVDVFSCTGKLIHSKIHHNTDIIKMRIRNGRGVYFVKISENNITQIRKIIKK